MLRLVALLAPVLAAGSYASLKEGAFTIERPAQTVAALVNACEKDGALIGECLENTKGLKDNVAGKRVLLNLGTGHERFLSFGGRRDGGKVRFVWAPLYDVGNGLALTVGKPQKLSDSGDVVVAKKPIDGTAPDELMDTDLQRLANTGQLGIEIIGRFGKPWRLAKGDKSVRGVTFDVEGFQLYNARSGKVVFESTQALH